MLTPDFKLALTTLLLFATVALAQDETTQTGENSPRALPPELELDFQDDFSIKRPNDYKITGNVSWESGKIKLSNEAVLQRVLSNAGPWVEIELNLEFPETADESQHLSHRIWIDFDKNTDGYVEFSRIQKDGKTVGLVTLWDTRGHWETAPKANMVGEAEIPYSELLGGKWGIVYRYGLWTVRRNKDLCVTAFTKKDNETPANIVLSAATLPSSYQSFSVKHSRHPRKIETQKSKDELYKAKNLHRQFARHFQQREFQDAKSVGEQLAALRLKLLGRYHLEYADILKHLAYLHFVNGYHAVAEKHYLEAVEINEKVLGRAHPDYASIVKLHGLNYHVNGTYDKAETCYLAAKQIYEDVFGRLHAEYSSSVNNLAALYEDQGAYEVAEPLYIEAMEIREKTMGSEHPRYATVLNNLAFFYASIGMYKKAEGLYLRCIEIRKKALGPNSLEYSSTLNNLAMLHHALGAYEKAEPLYLQAKQIREDVVGKEHPAYAQSLANLGNFYMTLGKDEKSEPMLLQALEIEEKTIGVEHLSYAQTLNNLALYYESKGSYAKALPLYRQAVQVNEAVVGKNHHKYTNALNNLAILHKSMGSYEKSEALFKQTIALDKELFGEEHPQYATALNNLGKLYCWIGAFEKAEPLYLKAKRIRENVLGDEHPDFIGSVINLAMLYEMTGAHDKAETQFLKCVQARQLLFDRYAAIQTERQQLAYQRSFHRELDGYLSATQRFKKKRTLAFELALNWKGQIQLRQSTYRTIANNEASAELFERYRSVSQRLFKHLDGDTAKKTWQDRLQSLSAEKEEIEKRLAATSTKFAQSSQRISLKQLQASLPDDAVFVNFHRYLHTDIIAKQRINEWRLLAFVVPKNGAGMPQKVVTAL